MDLLAKSLIVIGILIAVCGLILLVGGKVIPLGRLPGDIFIETAHGKFYFPLMTCAVVSIILSLLAKLFMR